MKNLMPKLKRLAKQLNCEVEDNRCGTAIEVQTKVGWSWEDGERCSMHRAYGSGGSGSIGPNEALLFDMELLAIGE